MMNRLRDLWAERPAIIAAAVIAPIAFVITLLVLFLAVGNGEGAQPQQAAAEIEPQPTEQADQQTDVPRRQNVVVSDVRTGDQSEQRQGESAETSAAQSQQQSQTQVVEQQGTQSGQANGQTSVVMHDQDESRAADSEPSLINGQPVMPLSEVLEETYDEEALKHGTDGSEGGILPIDNGVVVSSRPEHQTSWELIVPSAGLKSALVRVGRTPRGAMGSPDNPYVIGWLDSSAAPGETGNTLLAGHRDFEDVSGNIGTGVCWELVNTEPGDQMLVRDNDQDIYYVYTVTETVTLDPRDRDSARYLSDTEEPVITLITCTGSFNADTHQYSHRFVVVGVLAAVASPEA